jgi:hypothetical protein
MRLMRISGFRSARLGLQLTSRISREALLMNANEVLATIAHKLTGHSKRE